MREGEVRYPFHIARVGCLINEIAQVLCELRRAGTTLVHTYGVLYVHTFGREKKITHVQKLLRLHY